MAAPRKPRAHKRAARKRPPSATPIGRLTILFESLRDDVKACAEATMLTRQVLIERMDQFEVRVHQRFEVLEHVVRQNSQDIQKNSQDIQKNSQDIQKNSQDIEILNQAVHRLNQDVQRLDQNLQRVEQRVTRLESVVASRAEVEALDRRVSTLERSAG